MMVYVDGLGLTVVLIGLHNLFVGTSLIARPNLLQVISYANCDTYSLALSSLSSKIVTD